MLVSLWLLYLPPLRRQGRDELSTGLPGGDRADGDIVEAEQTREAGDTRKRGGARGSEN